MNMFVMNNAGKRAECSVLPTLTSLSPVPSFNFLEKEGPFP